MSCGEVLRELASQALSVEIACFASVEMLRVLRC